MINSELRSEHQAACDLVQSKNRLLELGQVEIIQLRESLSQAIAQQEEQGARWENNLWLCKHHHYFQTKNVPYTLTDKKRLNIPNVV